MVDTAPATPELLKALEIIAEDRQKLDQLQAELREASNIAAHWQARAILAEEQARRAEDQVKLLMAPKDESAEEQPADPEPKRSWWKRLLGD
jgi:hypothetical protein